MQHARRDPHRQRQPVCDLRGKSQFTRELEKRGIKQIVATPRRPQTLGKIERFWGTLWRECVESRGVRIDLGDAQKRIGTPSSTITTTLHNATPRYLLNNPPIFVFWTWYRGGRTVASLFHDLGRRFCLQCLSAEDPRSIREWMVALDAPLAPLPAA